jgi:hypothetical protein
MGISDNPILVVPAQVATQRLQASKALGPGLRRDDGEKGELFEMPIPAEPMPSDNARLPDRGIDSGIRLA